MKTRFTKKIINTLAILVLSLLTIQLNSQPITIKSIGKNKIAIHNITTHAISLRIKSSDYLIPQNGTLETSFNLSTYNVNHTPLIFSYDLMCLKADTISARFIEQKYNNQVNAFVERVAALIALFPNECNWVKFIGIIRGLQFFGGSPAPFTDQFFEETSLILNNRNTNQMSCDELSEAALAALEKTKLQFYNSSEEYRINSIRMAYNCLENIKDETIYASQILKKNVKGERNISLYHVSNFNIGFFRNREYATKEINKISLDQKPYYGINLLFGGNIYRNGKRNDFRKQFLSLDLMQTPIMYKVVVELLVLSGQKS